MEKLRIENLSTKEMTSVFAGGIFNKFFGPIGIIYTICGIVDDFQKREFNKQVQNYEMFL